MIIVSSVFIYKILTINVSGAMKNYFKINKNSQTTKNHITFVIFGKVKKGVGSKNEIET